MHVNTRFLSLGVVIGAVFMACGSSQRFDKVAPEDVDLAGTWVLNTEESDNPGPPTDQVGAPGMGERGGMMPPPGGMGGRPGGPGGRGGMGGMDPEEMRQTMDVVREAARRIDLLQDDSTVTLKYDQRPPLVLHIDGRELEQQLPSDTKLKIRAGWQGRYFVVERKIDGGGTITEQYYKSSVTDQLQIITRVELGRMPQPMEFMRVYDAAGESKE
jgi:hypothetical protein